MWLLMEEDKFRVNLFFFYKVIVFNFWMMLVQILFRLMGFRNFVVGDVLESNFSENEVFIDNFIVFFFGFCVWIFGDVWG